MPITMMEHLEEILNRTNIHTIFPKLRSLRGAFVLRFESEMNHIMSAHIDSPGTNGHHLSVVISLSNQYSGSVEMSNRDDGSIVETKNSFLFSAASRTAHAFHGSFATHAVRNLPRSEPFDRRYSLVLFYETDYSEMEAALCWGGEAKCNNISCEKCKRLYQTQRAFQRHVRGCANAASRRLLLSSK
jgi:hypothetical protein